MLLKDLSEAFGVSGAEGEVRDILKMQFKDYANIKTDVLGNLFINNNNKIDNQNKISIMLCAHMDEVGLIIKSIDENGWLKFNTVGGIDSRVLISKCVVVGPKKIKGVIGAKAIHLQEPKERERPLRIDNLYIDIGAKDKEEAENLVRVGDYAVFDTKFEKINEHMIKGKAFDDRIGCYILCELIKKRYKTPLTAVFTVQEEVGLRGSAVAAYNVNPDLAIVVEGTFASDIPESNEIEYCTTLGEGPAITFMDSTYIADKKIIEWVKNIANKCNISYQLKRTASGGTDGGRIYITRQGIPTIIISVPCRYIHSPVSLACIKDIKNTINLINALILDIEERGFKL
jgi:putative aminopeptidase FrvX